MSTVTVIVKRIGSVGDKIPSMDIVSVAILIIVNSVSGNFPGICPDICREVGMSVKCTGVNDCYYDLV